MGEGPLGREAMADLRESDKAYIETFGLEEATSPAVVAPIASDGVGSEGIGER